MESTPPPQPAVEALGNPLVLSFGGILCLALFVGVILPAVWSRKPTRRSAAYRVMDRIFRLFRPRS
ncbi:hypothetical protein FR742_38405 [Nonomuraea sp. C10]|nr:hypothetical protein FR742_38405 [Nonomuraea sp. C10]